MSIDDNYIKKIKDLTNEVLEKEPLTPVTRLLIETLMPLCEYLYNENRELKIKLESLEEKIKKLEVSANKDSHNSSLPPSRDFRKRYPTKKEKSKRPTGGQVGHAGNTLLRSDNPNVTINHKLKGKCSRCGIGLNQIKKKKYQKRQVFDVAFNVQVTEHIAESGTCSCGKKHTASFPEGVTANVQYGNSVRSLVNYLSTYQLLPFERTQELFGDLFNLPLSEGTIYNTIKRSHTKLSKFEVHLKEALLNSKVNHADETPVSVNKEKLYLHVVSNEHMTLLSAHKSRGMKAVNSIGVLNKYKGFLVSDFFSMYYSLPLKNISCHAHLKREFTLLEEEYKCKWAKKIRKFFCHANKRIDKYREKEKPIPYKLQLKLKDEYNKIIIRAKLETPGFQMKGKKSIAENLLLRILTNEDAVLRFMEDPEIPFTNNMAERDLRMSKVKQKVSGCFRSAESAIMYARMRSYISTVKKQGRNVWESLLTIHQGQNPNYIELFT